MEEAEEVEAIRYKERVEIAVVLVMLPATMMMMILRMMVTVTVTVTVTVIVTVTVTVTMIALRSATVMGANTMTKEGGRTLLIIRTLVQTRVWKE